MVRVAVIGVGHLGQHHARIYSSLHGCRLVGVVDVNRERAKDVAEKYGVKSLDFGDLFGRVDAVSIAVPTIDHFMVASAFLNNDCHILVEKPMAATIEEAQILIDLARRKNRVLFVGHTERFNPVVQEARKKIADPGFIETHRLGTFSRRSTDIDVVLDLMIHDLDIILNMVRDEIESVDSIGVRALTDKIDIANARIRFKRGCVANITASRISKDKVRKIRIFQPESYISIDCAAQEAQYYHLVRGESETPQIKIEDLAVEKDEPLKREIVSFLTSIREGKPAEIPGEDGVMALSLAFRILEGMKG
ncbi:MAG: Gfo/Idh/MocA family oxidoreductase [Acidobacteriota bacterium]